MDGAGFFLAEKNWGRELLTAGFFAMLLGALGSLAAVASGLVLSKGEMLGHDALRFHHLFVWPAFGLMNALAAWRLVVKTQASRRAFGTYLILAVVASALMAGAGYWGGQMVSHA